MPDKTFSDPWRGIFSAKIAPAEPEHALNYRTGRARGRRAAGLGRLPWPL